MGLFSSPKDTPKVLNAKLVSEVCDYCTRVRGSEVGERRSGSWIIGKELEWLGRGQVGSAGSAVLLEVERLSTGAEVLILTICLGVMVPIAPGSRLVSWSSIRKGTEDESI